MGRIIGADRHAARLRHMASGGKVTIITQALFVAGNEIQVEAQHSITEGAVTGKGHVASLPGQPPNADTHTLDRQIETAIVRPGHVEVSSSAQAENGYSYAVGLEVGNSRVEERPYMRPAAAKKRARVVELIGRAVAVYNRGFKG